MPQFRFRVVTPDGRVRSGRFTGNTLEEARRQIEESGLNVLELVPVEEASPVQTARRRRFGPGQISGYWVAAALACSGVTWGLLSWRNPAPGRPRPARDAIAMADRPFQADFQANWESAASANGARLIYRFPEIPYQVEQNWPQAQAKIHFLAARQPSYCLVELRNPQGVLAKARIQPILAHNEFSLIGVSAP